MFICGYVITHDMPTFKDIFTYVEKQGKRERDREIFHQQVHFPNAKAEPGWAQKQIKKKDLFIIFL